MIDDVLMDIDGYGWIWMDMDGYAWYAGNMMDPVFPSAARELNRYVCSTFNRIVQDSMSACCLLFPKNPKSARYWYSCLIGSLLKLLSFWGCSPFFQSTCDLLQVISFPSCLSGRWFWAWHDTMSDMSLSIRFASSMPWLMVSSWGIVQVKCAIICLICYLIATLKGIFPLYFNDSTKIQTVAKRCGHSE